jgi:uncharacterized membrane protein YkoI
MARTMQRKTKWIAGGALAVAVIAVGAGMGIAATNDDEPLTGSTLDRAVDAALQETGGGTIVETEVGDGGAAYSVEIRLEDGRQVEVNLDENFDVIGSEADDDGPNEREDEGGSENE